MDERTVYIYTDKPRELGEHFMRHMDAMTREKLHGKADIACELGGRDKRIEELEARVAELEARISNAPERAVFLKHDVDIGDALDKYVVSLNRWGTLDNNPNAVLANEDALLRTVVRAALQEGE